MDFTCRTAVVGSVPSVPDLRAWDTTISEFFSTASRTDQGQPAIDLLFDDSRESIDGPQNVTALDLHRALGSLVGRQPERGPATKLGLIFAGYYAPFPDALGVMFDEGFATGDDPLGHTDCYRKPREGCAVFLGRIADLYEPTSQPLEYQKEVVFTAIHELGHVFNLVHRDGTHFLTRDFRPGGDDRSYFSFTDQDKRWLRRCPDSSIVYPGGRPFLGIDGRRAGEARVEEAERGLAMASELSRDRVSTFGPLELDVSLSLSKEAAEEVSLPHEIDPGYDRFRIFIEDPHGQVAVFASSRHYCRSRKRLILQPGDEFKRDISLFGSARGYTFWIPGRHRVWADLQLPGGSTLRSTPSELEVLGPDVSNDEAFFADPQIARLLYYRSAPVRSKAPQRLEDFLSQRPKLESFGAGAYALGRTWLDRAKRLVSKRSRKRYLERSLLWLERSLNHESLGTRQQRIAETILEDPSI